MADARQTAFKILLKIGGGAYSNIALDAALSRERLSREDKALVSALVYTVVERMITIDYNLSLYLERPIKKLKPQVLAALRLGCAQLFFMDRIPSGAAVNESVKLVRNNGCAYAAGIVNAVLHRAAENGLVLPDEDDVDYLSVKYSCPQWLADLWSGAYWQENAEGIMGASLGAAENVIRVNTLKTTPEKLMEELTLENVQAKRHERIQNALVLGNTGAIDDLSAYRRGLFHAQDTASQLCSEALGAREGETVLDLCSAPGGKAFTIAQMMNNGGRIFAFDIHEKRVRLIKEGAKRLGISNITASVHDASVFSESIPEADRILCDVPCSGLGVICKKPEIRYKTPQDIDKLPDLQYFILSTAAGYLKKGGTLVYSTCSLNPSENGDVCRHFLSEHGDFFEIPVLTEYPKYGGDGFVTLMPHISRCDGFFIAAMKRSG
jgi:16S rRNA (cytosine967-C5)-methyltransferase